MPWIELISRSTRHQVLSGTPGISEARSPGRPPSSYGPRRAAASQGFEGGGRRIMTKRLVDGVNYSNTIASSLATLGPTTVIAAVVVLMVINSAVVMVI